MMNKPHVPEDSAPTSAPEEQDLVDLVVAEQAGAVAWPARIDGVVVGELVSVGADGAPVVDHPLLRAPLPARSVIALAPGDVGCELALVFEGGDPAKPLVMGRMHVPTPPSTPLDMPAPGASGEGERASANEAFVRRDGERVEIEAEREIVLRCGAASITLTRAGRIILRGTYVLSRSSGVNRLQGGSVEIN